MSSRWIVPAVLIAALAGAPAMAQKFVYPGKGQSPQQQQAQQQQQAAQQQTAANAAGPEAYTRARTACLTGRGYTVN